MEADLSPEEEPTDQNELSSSASSSDESEKLKSIVHSVAKKAENKTVADSVERDTCEKVPHIDEENDPILIINAGLPRSGKSRASSTIFDLDFEHACSASSVTSKVEKKDYVKYHNTLKIFDVPGLGATDIPIKTVIKQLKKEIGNSEYVVLYCISVAPSHSLNFADVHAMETLQKALGRNVWKKCVLLLTFSDTLRKEAKENYHVILRDHVKEINKLLQKTQKSWLPFLNTATEVILVDDIDYEQETIGGIAAIPVSYDENSSKEMEIWKNQAIIEILRLKEPLQRKRFLQLVLQQRRLRRLRSSLEYSSTGTINTVAGASLGGVVGGAIGAAAGGVGAIPGFAVGALIGAAVSGTAFLTMSQVILILYNKNKHSEDEATSTRTCSLPSNDVEDDDRPCLTSHNNTNEQDDTQPTSQSLQQQSQHHPTPSPSPDHIELAAHEPHAAGNTSEAAPHVRPHSIEVESELSEPNH